MNITYFQRKPDAKYFSIEIIFDLIRRSMPEYIDCSVYYCRFRSKGLFKRAWNMVEAVFYQGDVNHITGDDHYLAIFLCRRKTILTIHDCGLLESSKGIKRSIYKLLWYYLPTKRCSLVTVISEATRRELVKHINLKSEKIRIVPDCIFQGFKPYPKKFNAQKPRILQVGTKNNKNINRLADALRGIPCHLRIIGPVQDEQRKCLNQNLIDYSSAAGLSSDEMVEEYRRCDMVAFVSTYEGFGLPIIEANATGRPVLTSPILSMPEVGKDAACYSDPYSVQDIRDGILRIINDEGFRNDLVQNGYKNSSRYRPEKIAQQYLKIYKELREI